MKSSDRLSQRGNYLVRRFAALTAAATFGLIVVGALVTSNDAGDSVPDWPTSFGKVVPVGQIVGNVIYEYSHRVVAATVGLLTIVLNIMLQRREERRWVRRVGLFALAAVMAQGLLGGARVLLLEYRFATAMTHAFLAQFFFCLTMGLATFTSPGWMAAGDRKFHAGPLRRLCALAVIALFAQLLLGAAFRHRGIGILPHIIGAVVVSALIISVAVMVLKLAKSDKLQFVAVSRESEWRNERQPESCRTFSEETDSLIVNRLRRLALWALVLLGVQLILGVAAYFARVASHSDPQPLPPMVYSTAAHVACGALVLAVVLGLTLRVFHLSVQPERVADFKPQRATS